MRPGPLAFLIPVLARPGNVLPMLKRIPSVTPPPCRILFIASPGDEAEITELEHRGAKWIEHEGNYAEKINAGIRATSEPLLFIGADDVRPHLGWLEAALERASETGAEVIGINDLIERRHREHATHFLVSRRYVEEHGTIDEEGKLLHEGYPHEWVDNELIETAQMRGLYAYAEASVVEHLHPIAGKAPMDDLYAASRPRMRAGYRVYRRRRALWHDRSA